jgi:carbon-monoxide dehydrogenase small subunit
MGDRAIRMVVNGREREGLTEPRRTLADFLREDLQLTGTHLGCEHGACGACTVLMDGEPIRSCLLLAVQSDGSELLTIEGLEEDGRLSLLQEAMRDAHSFQCGFCTPGFLMAAHALLRERADRPEEEWREELSGHLCRCTGYQSIIDGVRLAAQRLASGQGVTE